MKDRWLKVALALGLLLVTPAVREGPDSPGFLAPVAQAQGFPGQAESDGQRIAGISLFGNRTTREYVIRRELGIEVGDAYDPELIETARERLEELPFIEWVEIQEKSPGPDEVLLVIQIEEAKRRVVGFGLDYDRRFSLVWGLALSLQNFRGRAEELSFSTAWGHLQGYHLRWQNPWVLGRARIGVGVEAGWERYGFVYEPFRLTDASLKFSLWHDLGHHIRATAYAEERGLEVDRPDLGFYGDSPPQDAHDPALGLELEHDSRDLAVYPRRGIRARAAARWAGLSEGSPYQIYDANLAVFVPLPYVGIGAGQTRYRLTSKAVPVYERAVLGGPADLRGIPFSSVRGDEFLLASMEVRKPLAMYPLGPDRIVGIGLHAFHDWGKAWPHGSGVESVRTRWSRGIGVHLNLGARALRFEWARSDEGQNSFVFEDQFTF